MTADDGQAGGAARNFARLLELAFEEGADYVFCCDQDDVWQPDKLSRVLERLRGCERAHAGPCLVHHDLRVVDENLQVIEDSYWAMMKLQPADARDPQRLLSRNEVTGCALACNRELLEIALPIPPEAIMHDWWLALCAGWFGAIAPIPETLVEYRQHGANAIGAKSFLGGLPFFGSQGNTWREGNLELLGTASQARAFGARMAGRLDSDAAMTVARYAALPRSSRRQRLRTLRECRLWRNNAVLDASLVLRMLLLRRAAE